MPLGLVRSGDFRKGTPIVLPHQFGNPAISTEPFGNALPQANTSLDSNPVTWPQNPAHFGNTVDLSLQTVPPTILISPGTTNTVNINLAQLLGTPTPTLAYSGAPAGVTLTFTPNPNTGTSACTITVGSSVATGRYTIAITGTTGTEVNNTNLHLIVTTLGYANLFLLTTFISSSQLLSMSTNPIILVPAQGPNTVISPVWWTLEYKPGTTPYGPLGFSNLYFNMGYNPGAPNAGPEIPLVDFFGRNPDIGNVPGINAPLLGYPIFSLSAAVNAPLTLTLEGGAITAGNGTVSVNVWYFVVPTV